MNDVIETVKGLMYFQVWAKQKNTASFSIKGMNDILSEHSPIYEQILTIFKHCKDNNIECDGVMVHHSKGCFFADNNK